MRRRRRPLDGVMPLAPDLPALATPLYDELKRLVENSVSLWDYAMYNFGTGVALAASGAAAVVADVNAVLASSLAAVAAFFVAMTRILSFGRRWAFGLDRRARYAGMIYELNAVSGRPPDEQVAEIARLYGAMRAERLRDAALPGVSDTTM